MPARGSLPDEAFMREALKLARAPRVLPYPNPWVGCVIVKDGRIVGRGFHRGPGTNHAEVEALGQAGRQAKGSTLYVTLEPCCHFGNTPPCTDAILRAGVRRVVYALRDPNPAVAGRGARILKRRGVEVSAGLCSWRAAEINEVYLKFRATGLPFVTAKMATTLDGKISTRTGESKWITGTLARHRARMLRSQNQAILVGINTVMSDDPHLGVRRRGFPDPWRVILDSSLRIPSKSRVVHSGKCIVACAGAASAKSIAQLQRQGVTVWQFKGKRVPLRPLLAKLATRGVISLLVEGGSEVLGSFFDGGFVDKVYWFVSPIILGSARSRAAVGGTGVSRLAEAWRLRAPTFERVGNSWLIQGNLYSKAPAKLRK